MSLKLLVNNPTIYASFLEELESQIETQRKLLEQAQDTVQIYQAQGAIKALRKLKALREAVNGRD